MARLATTRADGQPHLVPVTFVVLGERILTRVDHKPKRTDDLQRLRNLRSDPRCTLLVDHYEDDWSRLWWVRADGRATITERPADDDAGVVALVARYEPYQRRPPTGPLVTVEVTRWVGWRAGPKA